MDYFIFQNKENAGVAGLFQRLQNEEIDVSNKKWTDFISAAETTLRNHVNGVDIDPYFDSFYARFYTQDARRNSIVDLIKEQAKQLFLSRIPIFLEKMQYIVPGPRGELPDFTGSPESKLYIDELFKKDFILDRGGSVEDTHFITNLRDIAVRISRTLERVVNIDVFVSEVVQRMRLNDNKLLIYTGRRNRDTTSDGDEILEGSIKSSMQKTKSTRVGGARNPTKKKQHKNKRSLKRKKNKKRAIKTQKNKRNKTRK